VAVAFFGDGAANQGVLAEALNVASLWKLPLILIVENNGFSEFSHSKDVTAGQIYRRAEAFGVSSERVDGNDVVSVWDAAARAIERARRGEGPGLIEAMTYRLHGHTESEKSFLAKPYRSDAEIDSWRQKDPLAKLATRLVDEGLYSAEAVKEVAQEVARNVLAAADAAGDSAWPNPEQAFQQMFA